MPTFHTNWTITLEQRIKLSNFGSFSFVCARVCSMLVHAFRTVDHFLIDFGSVDWTHSYRLAILFTLEPASVLWFVHWFSSEYFSHFVRRKTRLFNEAGTHTHTQSYSYANLYTSNHVFSTNSEPWSLLRSIEWAKTTAKCQESLHIEKFRLNLCRLLFLLCTFAVVEIVFFIWRPNNNVSEILLFV